MDGVVSALRVWGWGVWKGCADCVLKFSFTLSTLYLISLEVCYSQIEIENHIKVCPPYYFNVIELRC